MMLSLQEIYNKDTAPDGFGDKGTAHSYIEYYSDALENYRNTSNTVIEIGVCHGHSLRMWREFFTQANVVGVDLYDRNANCTGCEIKIGDATKRSTFDQYSNIDVVIDDGSHEIAHQLATFEILWPKLNPGGIYLIEDIRDIDASKSALLALHPNAKIHDFRSNKGRYDDVIVEIRKDA